MNEKYYLPALTMLKDGLFYVIRERKNFIAMAALPIIGLSILNTILAYSNAVPIINLDPQTQNPGVNADALPRVLMAYITGAVLYVMFAVAWHRKWLVGESEITIYTALKWDRRKTKFLVRSLQIFAISIAVIFILVQVSLLFFGVGNLLLSPVGFMIALAIFILTFARFSLLLPAAAVEDPMDLKSCWQMTHGNGWRLGVLAILPPIPLAFIQIVIQTILSSILTALDMPIDSLVIQLFLNLIQYSLNYFGIAVGISALSMAYRAFEKQKISPSE